MQRVENPRQVGKEKLEKLVEWMWKWGWSTDKALCKLLDAENVGSRFAKRGYLDKATRVPGCPTCYSISVPIQSKALVLYERNGGTHCTTYPFPGSEIPVKGLSVHQETSQIIAMSEIRRYESEGCSVYLTTEREIREQMANEGKKTGAIPDFILTVIDGEYENVIWYETELTGKYKEKLVFQLQERHEALKKGLFNQLVFACRTPSIERNIRTELMKDVLPKIVKRGDGRLVVTTSEPGWSTRQIKAATDTIQISNEWDQEELF